MLLVPVLELIKNAIDKRRFLNGVDNAGGVSGKIQYLKETYCKDCRVISSRNSKNLWVAMIFSDGDGN